MSITPKQKNAITRRDLIILCVVLFAAALMRLGDNAVFAPLNEPSKSILGTYYLQLAYANAPYIPLMIAILNIAGVGLLWLLAHRYFHPTIALIAALYYALSPYAILNSHTLSAVSLYAQLMLITLNLVLYLLEKKRKIALGIFLIAYLLTNIITKMYVYFPTTQPDAYLLNHAQLPENTLNHLAMFISGLGIEQLAATPDTQAHLLANVPPQPQLWLLFVPLAIFGAVIFCLDLKRIPDRLLRAFIIVAIFAIFLTAEPTTIALIVAIVAMFIGYAVYWLMRNLPGQPLARTIVLTAFCAIVLSQAIWWRGFVRYLETTTPPSQTIEP